MEELGLATNFVQTADQEPTGTAAVNADASGEAQFIISRPAAFDLLEVGSDLLEALHGANFDWLYFGTLMQVESRIENYTGELARILPQVRCFYDMNLRSGHWSFPLVQRLCGMASVLKLSEAEAKTIFASAAGSGSAFCLEQFCSSWASKYDIAAICVTRGPGGCVVYAKGEMLECVGYPITVCDTVGAGDAFAAAFLHGYHRAWPMERTLRFANALGALVASRPGATPEWRAGEVNQIMAGQRV